MHTKNEQLINRLIQKSESGDIRWNTTDVTNQYLLKLSDKSLIVTKTTTMGATRVRFEILANDGQSIDSISRIVSGGATTLESNTLDSLYETARRNANRINETIDDLLSHLD